MSIVVRDQSQPPTLTLIEPSEVDNRVPSTTMTLTGTGFAAGDVVVMKAFDTSYQVAWQEVTPASVTPTAITFDFSLGAFGPGQDVLTWVQRSDGTATVPETFMVNNM